MNMRCHQQVTSTCRTSQARRERRLKVHGNSTQTAPKQGESIAFVSVQSKDSQGIGATRASKHETREHCSRADGTSAKRASKHSESSAQERQGTAPARHQ